MRVDRPNTGCHSVSELTDEPRQGPFGSQAERLASSKSSPQFIRKQTSSEIFNTSPAQTTAAT